MVVIWRKWLWKGFHLNLKFLKNKAVENEDGKLDDLEPNDTLEFPALVQNTQPEVFNDLNKGIQDVGSVTIW